MRRPNRRLLLGLGFLLAALLPIQAHAGCGCDHPPPAWDVVMPPFGSPGKTIALFATGGDAFVPGETYEVKFGSPEASAIATMDDRLEVTVPDGVNLGPVEIEVRGPGVDHKYAKSDFTALPDPRVVPEQAGFFGMKDYRAAIGEDGTLYVPLDLTSVLAAMQFALVMDMPLRYGHDDVVIYNADGVDLTLFTLTVEDPTERQWGSYYGWEVQQDGGIPGVIYEGQTDFSGDLELSDVFTYWRHEFFTYAGAHMPGQSHAVDAHGRHPDGTLHVDHNNLVIAIHGLEDGSALGPGERQIDVGWAVYPTENPVEIGGLSFLAQLGLMWSAPQFEIRRYDDDDDD